MRKDVYISITGLQVRRVWHIPSFWSHAMKSLVQARNAPGNISADARTINGVHHTLSIWTDKDAMRAYLITGPHLAAMRLFPSIATGKAIGYRPPMPPQRALFKASLKASRLRCAPMA